MKKALFRKLLTAMAATLGLCLLVYPLLLPTENYFRLVLQLLPLSLVIGAVMLIPLHFISENFSRNTAQELKKLRIDSKAALTQYPELRPLARQVSSLKAQIDTQMNELTGQQEQLRVLTDNMQEGLLLISATGRVLSHNHAALQLLGQEISPHNDILSVYALSEAEQFQLVVGQALDGARASAIITVGDTAVQLIANPVARENRLTGAVMVLLDVTEREKRDALRREFTANISHELKTPLTSIYGIADMMESGMVKKKDISGFARRIRDESSRMIALIEDIIRLSRLDDESFTEEVLPLDLYEIAENVREQLLPAAEAKQLTVTLEGTPAPMRGVPVIVEEMLYNLCDNAIKYNVENGAVHIKVTRTDQQAVFSVTDTGIGIPQADRERIFERFYRVDKSHSKQIGGTGLGLSIVKHGALFHNATIELESQLGSGTTITLFFPRSAEAAAAAESSARLNPLNVDIPGASEPQLIHVRESAPEPEEITETAAEPETEPEEAAVLTEEPADAAEPEAEPTAEPEETAEAESEEPDEAAQEQSEETEELPENEPEPLTLFDEAELQPEPEPEQASEPYPDPEDETDRLIREAVAALELEVFDDDNEQEPEAEAEEVFYYEDDDGEPVEEPEADLIIPEPEEPVAEPRRIDVVPIDEDTMDIRI